MTKQKPINRDQHGQIRQSAQPARQEKQASIPTLLPPLIFRGDVPVVLAPAALGELRYYVHHRLAPSLWLCQRVVLP